MKEHFPKDHTHTNPAGAELNAALIVAEWKRVPDVRLTANLSPKGKEAKGATPEKRPLPKPADAKLPSLFLIGDSTVRNGQGDGADHRWGWGEPLAAFFDTTRINVVNRAVSGLSSRTYLTQGFWEQTLALIKAGDFVMIQFGHNDSAALNDTTRARGTIKGIGEETEELDNLLTKRHEIVHSYGWYLRNYFADIRAKGATPIICSLVPRKKWQENRIVREDYAAWAASAAKNAGVALIDLNAIVADKYEQLGAGQVEPLFADPPMHTSLEGAQLNAESIIAGLKTQPDIRLNGFLSEKAKTVQPILKPSS
jgi:lysophospholipase L1-like esterase